MQNRFIAQKIIALADDINKTGARRVYALIDGALHRAAFTRVQEFGRVQSVIPIGGVVAKSDLSVLPFLIDLSAMRIMRRDRLIADLSAWALEYSAVTWMESRLPIATLAEQLAIRLEAEVQQSMSVLLRFADARVLPVLHDTLDAEQRIQFFSCVTNWWFVSRRGELQSLPLHSAQISEPLAFKPPLHLSEQQEGRL